jgi:RNA polymerase sigma factor (sigma-70 family)
MTAAHVPFGDAERRLVEHLPDIDRITGAIAHRHALDHADADEFAAWAKARLVDGDYAIIRKFEGRSSFRTFLSVVLTNLFRDYRNQAWGRWRPSAAAQRMGPLAVRLEELLYRDGSSLREATEILRGTGAHTSDREIAELAAKLPARNTDGDLSIDEADLPAAPQLDTVATSAERQALTEALRQAVDRLPDEDRIILRMRYWDDVSVADIARALRVEQKPLYRRLEYMQTRIRDALEERGITRELALDVITEVPLW